MNHRFLALALQDADSSMWLIIIAVVVLLFFVVVIIGVGLVIFFVMRKKNKARAAELAGSLASGPGDAISSGSGYPDAAYAEAPSPAASELAVALDAPPAGVESPLEEMSADVADAASSPAPDSGALEFDPTRTVAINRESTVAISYGTIRFVSGVLADQEFEVQPEGQYIGREASLSQIVVADPRISKRHLWIGVKDGAVRIVDQESRNGTFVNDPKSERITEATLQSGDTIILGESDVARFEYRV